MEAPRVFGTFRLKLASLARPRRTSRAAVATWRALLVAATRRAWLGTAAVALGGLMAACSMNLGDFGMNSRPPAQQQPAAAIGAGEVKAALILPLSAAGGIGLAAQSLKNAAEMALAEYNAPNVQLLVKDDAGTVQGAQAAAQQALDEGAEIILGPLLAPSVTAVGQVARPRGVPVIAFSTDTNVAARGVYLLSLLPESEVDRIVAYAASQGRRAYAALIPENAYGTVVQAALQQTTARRGARVVVLERYGHDPQQMQAAIARVAQAVGQMDAVFIPDETDSVAVVQGLTAAGVNTRRIQLLGTRLWSDDPHIASNAALQGAWYAGPDPAGFRGFATRYRSRFGRDPVGRAEVAYDAVSLVAALVKTQGAQRFTEQVLTNPSGFSGVDGIFRFRQDGINERGLAVLRVGPGGGTVVSPAPKSFTGSGT
jgi:branched-chain amino acid transport system substrate-binding protein